MRGHVVAVEKSIVAATGNGNVAVNRASRNDKGVMLYRYIFKSDIQREMEME